jgi:hypothetical protein
MEYSPVNPGSRYARLGGFKGPRSPRGHAILTSYDLTLFKERPCALTTTPVNLDPSLSIVLVKATYQGITAEQLPQLDVAESSRNSWSTELAALHPVSCMGFANGRGRSPQCRSQCSATLLRIYDGAERDSCKR